MLVLHPYGDTRRQEQRETWAFLSEMRGPHRVIDKNVTGKWEYVNLLKSFWGTQDIIILEDDKVPTRQDFDELVACNREYCCFPYPINFQLRTTMSQWTDNFPFTTGFVKFTKAAQEMMPVIQWGPFFYGKESRPSIDRAIEEPLIRRFGPMHVHERFIRHNHKPTMKIIAKQYGARILMSLR